MLKPHQRHLIAQLQGGLILWQDTHWWVSLPAEIACRSPHLLARWALDGGEDHPRRVAGWLGSSEVYLLDTAALKRWKGRLVGAGLSAELLPQIDLLLAEGDRLPLLLTEAQRHRAQTVWRRLAPLLGRRRAEEALRFFLLADSPESDQSGYHRASFRRLKELFHQDRELRSNWFAWNEQQRVEIFENQMGARPDRREAMERMAAGTAWSEGLDRIYKAWLPTALDPAYYLALGLCRPGLRAPEKLGGSQVRELLQAHSYYKELTAKRFQMMLDTIGWLGLSGYLLAHTKLEPKALQFVKQHDLAEALENGGSWGRAERRFLRLCRQLLEAGLESRWLNDSTLRQRSGRLEAFVYLLLLDLEEAPTLPQAEVIDRLAPSGKLAEELFTRSEFPDNLRPDLGQLCRQFDLSPTVLEDCARWRLTLGLSAFPKRLQSWSPTRLASEREHLERALKESPEDATLLKRWEALRARHPDEREGKRIREELERASSELPRQHWELVKPKVLRRLLSNLVGSEVAESAPRLGFLLRQSEISIAQLASLRQDHPQNEAWLRQFERNGFFAAHWLDEWSTDFQVDGRHVDLVAESDPAEILEMGSHFHTCLSIDGGINAFSVLTNIVEVNKKVLLGRDVEGKVILRKLIGITLKGELVGYHTYSHWPQARLHVHRACAVYAKRHGYRLSDHARPESIISGLAWYDDGAEPWEFLEVPGDLPPDWPRDPVALRQWRLLSLKEGDWAPVRPVEFHWWLLSGRPIPEVASNLSWRFADAAELLALAGRFDRLSDPRLPLEARDRLLALNVCSGFEPTDCSGYARLLDPEHRVYRSETQEEVQSAFEEHRLAPVLILLSPGELRRTVEKLLRVVRPGRWGQLFSSMVDLVAWAYHLHPTDPSWRHFDSDLSAALMLEVATRQPMPCWRDALASWTKTRPEWASRCWFARALFEGDKIRETLEEQLSARREDLDLALAVVLAGGEPSSYRFPEGEELFDLDYLVAARPLAPSLERRFQRMEERGQNLTLLKSARKRLRRYAVEEWTSWPKSYRDVTLDRELTPKILRGEEPQFRAAWVVLGASGDRIQRLGLLHALSLEIPDEHRALLKERLLFLPGSARDELLRVALGDDLRMLSTWEEGTFHLALSRWPEILGPALLRLDLADRLAFLAQGAEILEPEVLKARLREYLGAEPLPASLVSPYLASEYDSVILQQELLTHPIEGELENLDSTERGRWAVERLSSDAVAGAM